MSKNKTFFSYVIPSVLAFALSGVYSVIDGLFVGNSIGDVGLSTINIAYPLVAFIQAAGTGIGMGGAVIYSLSSAAGDTEKAGLYAGGTGTFLVFASIIITVLLHIFLVPILGILGAEGEILVLGEKYLRIIVSGAALQIFSTGIIPMIRNCNGASFAMISMVSGFLANILFDYIFIWVLKWGISGAAAATILGQGITVIAGLFYMYSKKIPIFRFYIPAAGHLFCRIVKIGAAPFGLILTPNIAVILMNRCLAAYGGEQAVACYACIACALSIVYMFLQGVGDGSQPLMSKCYGGGNVKEYGRVRRLAYGLAGILAAVSICILFLGRFRVGELFGASEAVLTETGNVLPAFLAGILFVAFTRVTTSGFYASEKGLFSYILVYAEPILLFVFLLVLPHVAGLSGVWWSTCLSQIICAFIALFLRCLTDKRRKA